jgi:homoserine kinase
MEADHVIEPARAHLMPLLAEVRAAAHAVGAHGLVISGAGPTLAAICDTGACASATAVVMERVYRKAGIAAVSRACQIAPEGARVLESA